RAFHVTGVQTCALPIWRTLGTTHLVDDDRGRLQLARDGRDDLSPAEVVEAQVGEDAGAREARARRAVGGQIEPRGLAGGDCGRRSEERRVVKGVRVGAG